MNGYSSEISSSGSHVAPKGGFELFMWFFMRVSGLLLVLLALGHLVVMHIVNSIENIDYAFVAARYATPFWRTYDFLMLALAVVHGFNGGRTIVQDYVRSPGWRLVSLSAVYVLTFMFLSLGALVIFTFQPNI